MASNEVRKLHLLAQQQLAQSNPDLAIGTLQEAAKLEPDNALTYQNLALAHHNRYAQTQKRQHLKPALENVNESLRLNPESAHSYYLKSRILRFTSRNYRKEAKKLIKRAIALSPAAPLYYAEAGDVHASRFVWNRKHAEEFYKKALELQPNNAGTLARLANYYYSFTPDTVAAETYARDALRVDSSNPTALVIMGHILYSQKRYDEAREHAVSILTRNPKDYNALVLICMLESRRNIFLAGSYRLGLSLRKPLIRIIFYLICVFLVVTTYVGGAALFMYARYGQKAFRERVKKHYLSDVKLGKDF